MGTCIRCGNWSNTLRKLKGMDKYDYLCDKCNNNIYMERIESDLENVSKPVDFKSWEKRDMSEAFWIHLGKYKKCPNQKSLDVIYTAYLWACHDDHGLSNSFRHAMKWCGIDLLTEIRRKDLPPNIEPQVDSYEITNGELVGRVNDVERAMEEIV